MAHGSPQFSRSVKQQEVVIPDLTIKELLDAIPSVPLATGVVCQRNLIKFLRAHCFKRNGWRSSLYMYVIYPFRVCQLLIPIASPGSVGDFAALAVLYKTASYLDGLIAPEVLQLPHPLLYSAAKFSLWAIYTFWAGLVGTGLWIIAHECGHQAFSESKFLNNAVGWVLHSGWVYALIYHVHGADLRGLGWVFHIIRGVSPMRNITLLPVT